MPDPLKKRVVIVTGASRGLGRETALAFGRAGDRVVVNYLGNESAARDVVKEVISSGGEAFPFRADVRSAGQAEAMVIETENRWGSLDVLVNNAGITRDCLLLRMQEQDWNDVLDTNLKGPFHCIRAASRIMSEQRNGHIINIASIVGLQGREGQGNYSSSKAALIGLTKACAKELGRFNIKVNAVLPGYLPTDMGGKISGIILDRVLHENALNRVSEKTEVAEFIRHLSLMNNVSGQIFNLDSRVL